jgi:hypothetical protein
MLSCGASALDAIVATQIASAPWRGSDAADADEWTLWRALRAAPTHQYAQDLEHRLGQARLLAVGAARHEARATAARRTAAALLDVEERMVNKGEHHVPLFQRVRNTADRLAHGDARGSFGSVPIDDIEREYRNIYAARDEQLDEANQALDIERWVTERVDALEPTEHMRRRRQWLDYVGVVAPQAMRKARAHVKLRSAPGPDGVTRSHLDAVGAAVDEALSHIANHCVAHAVWPRQWRVGVTIGTPKIDGAELGVGDFRPITLTCMAERIVQRVLTQRMWAVVAANAHPAQALFHRGGPTSCNGQLMCSIDALVSAGRPGELAVAKVDVRKALD